jgi:hypothetical protein
MPLQHGKLSGFMGNLVFAPQDVAAFGLFQTVYLRHLLNSGVLVEMDTGHVQLADVNTLLGHKVGIITQKCLMYVLDGHIQSVLLVYILVYLTNV